VDPLLLLVPVAPPKKGRRESRRREGRRRRVVVLLVCTNSGHNCRWVFWGWGGVEERGGALNLRSCLPTALKALGGDRETINRCWVSIRLTKVAPAKMGRWESRRDGSRRRVVELVSIVSIDTCTWVYWVWGGVEGGLLFAPAQLSARCAQGPKGAPGAGPLGGANISDLSVRVDGDGGGESVDTVNVGAHLSKGARVQCVVCEKMFARCRVLTSPFKDAILILLIGGTCAHTIRTHTYH
jgi:hypothetical protein